MPFRILGGKKCSGNCPDCPNKKKKQEAQQACDEAPQQALLIREEAELFTGRREEFAI